jgi:hypothetical protein
MLPIVLLLRLEFKVEYSLFKNYHTIIYPLIDPVTKICNY